MFAGGNQLEYENGMALSPKILADVRRSTG